MIEVLIVILITMASLVAFVAGPLMGLTDERRYHRKPKDHLTPWGEGKDLSGLLRTKRDELEEWWNDTQSDKARIQQLENELSRTRFELKKARSAAIAHARDARNREAPERRTIDGSVYTLVKDDTGHAYGALSHEKYDLYRSPKGSYIPWDY